MVVPYPVVKDEENEGVCENVAEFCNKNPEVVRPETLARVLVVDPTLYSLLVISFSFSTPTKPESVPED